MTSFLISPNDRFIQQVEHNGVRYYEVMGKYGKQRYPSVSTLVNSFQNKDGLKQWADRLGYNLLTEEEKELPSETISELVKERGQKAANEVRDKAAKRGTKIHELCEKYYTHHIISDEPCFQRLLPFLQLCEPIAVETKVKWEKQLDSGQVVGWAGRFDNVSLVDLTQLYDNLGNTLGNKVPAIIDYKTWDKPKYNRGQTKDGNYYYPLLSYYLQLTAYLAAFNQCKYYSELIKDCFLIGVTETCKEAWLYHLNLNKINYLFSELQQMVLAYNKLTTYDYQELEARIEPYLGERVYLTNPKLPF